MGMILSDDDIGTGGASQFEPSGFKKYVLPIGPGDSSISQWSGGAHKSFSLGTPHLCVELMPFAEKRQAWFNFGTGWRDRFCSEPKAVYLTPPGTPYEWRFEGAVMVITLSIAQEQIDKVLDELEMPHQAIARVSPLCEQGFNDPLVHDMVMLLWNHVRLEEECNPLLVQSSMVCILHSIASRCCLATGSQPGQIVGDNLKRVQDWIESRLQQALNIAELAEVANVSKFHFIRLFSEATGKTPYQYIMHRRIVKARLLLLTTHLSVADIGVIVGFGDAPNFSRTFTKHVGISPSQYRLKER